MAADLASVVPFWQTLNWLDAVIILLAVGCAALGFLSGFVWQVLRIISVLAAFVLAARLHGLVARWLGLDLSENAQLLISFTAVFVAALLASYLILFLMRAPINALKPGIPDRVAGALLGGAKGVLVCGIITLLLMHYTSQGSAVNGALNRSFLARFCARGTSVLWELTPKGIGQRSPTQPNP